MKLSRNAKNALMLGTLCSVAYFAVYIARNILSTVTPQLIAAGFSEEDYIAPLSSLYLIFYAVGQLINGAIGDKIKARWMLSMGLLGAGLTNILFIFIAESTHNRGDFTTVIAMLAYALTGFFLSMIYGPMTKVVSENTEPIHAVRCSVGYTFASLFGSPAAGILATFLVWQNVFAVSSFALFAMALACFVLILIFEKRGIVKYGQIKPDKKQGGSIKLLFKHHIVKFSLVAILTGIVRTSVVFWLPTYILQQLKYSEEQSTTIFSIATFIISFTAIIAVFIYERLKRNVNVSLLLMFGASVIFFLLTYFTATPSNDVLRILNLVCIVLAIMSANGASSMLWSVYCPSLKETGVVSGATGFLDFLSYTGAAIANIVFANAAKDIGWGNLILVWMGLMIVGVIISLPFFKSWTDPNQIANNKSKPAEE